MVCNWDIKVFFFFSPALQMQKVFLKNNFWSVWKSSPESLLSARKCAPHKAKSQRDKDKEPRVTRPQAKKLPLEKPATPATFRRNLTGGKQEKVKDNV